MRAFDLDRNLVTDYEAFSRSFTRIRAADLRQAIDQRYADGRFWPDALLSINPQYERGPTADSLAADGVIDPSTAQVFRADGSTLRFYRHQGQAIAKAQSRQSFVVTTGTGPGKSMCFFVPIVDAVIRARKTGAAARTRAIIVYPMNALANSQIEEIDGYINQAGLPDDLTPRVQRYTGQEKQDERQRVAANPPDILLTNYMMLELLLTRQDPIDKQVIANAAGLQFIVLDELHTYRGRQGADVALLVRRLRDRCGGATPPICIGTSATMASEGDDAARSATVSSVASRLFGTPIGPDAVIDESLRRATDDSLNLETIRPTLRAVVEAAVPEMLTDDALRTHSLAVWAELALGLEDKKVLRRARPITFGMAADKLADDTGLPSQTCRTALEAFLTRASLPETARGGAGDKAFLAFKLHRFIAGSGEVYTTLRAQRVGRIGVKARLPTEETVAMVRFLDGVPREHMLQRLAKADGDEIGSGKFASEESSAALAVNTFGWFIERPELLPPLPGMQPGAKVLRVEVEYCARFPWRGGKHPWLDAVVETDTQLVGVESKRFEPYRDVKTVSFSKAYSDEEWGPAMSPFEAMRDALAGGRERFRHLDAAQLVKHAFGLVTQGRRLGKAPVLVYLFAEPARLGDAPLPATGFAAHRAEIARFAAAVEGAQVSFHAISYREWLATWPRLPSPVGQHANAIEDTFHPW